MFEYHNNILAVQAGFVYNKPFYDRILKLEKDLRGYIKRGEDDIVEEIELEIEVFKKRYKRDPKTFLTIFNYKAKKKRGQIKSLTTGGNGRTALVEWDSLPLQTRERIIEEVGYDPANKTKDKTFKDYIVYDQEAFDFYSTYTKSNGENLSQKQIESWTSRASIFNGVQTLLKERESKRSAFGKSQATLWKNIAKAIADLSDDSHKLPKNHRRLKQAFDKYNAEGYIGLVHGGIENDNSQKIKGEIADWLLAQYCLPNKMVIPVIMQKYTLVAEKEGWPTLSEQAVWLWLEKPEIKRKWVLARDGKEEYMRQFGHFIKRKKAEWFPNAYWAIDGSKLDWVHYWDNVQKMAAQLKIDIVIDIFSEKIIGWSYSDTENQQDHFKAIKMAVNNAGAKPYLFTYDHQSGHKTETMQELYDKVVASKGGVHYPHRAKKHNSPVEDIFRRLQQQVVNQFWWSDKQSPTVRTQNNKPNIEFIQENKHLLKSKEELLKAWEVCVKLWNEAKHPKHQELTRSEVFEMDAPMREEVNLMDMVDMFWITKPKPITYKRGGIELKFKQGKTINTFEYEVLNNSGLIDIRFRERHVGNKFIVKYDPEFLNDFIQLFAKDASGNLTFVANAQPKREHEVVPVLMKEGDKEAWRKDYDVTDLELQRDLKAIEELRKRTGITPEKMIEEQELMIKLGGDLPKEERTDLESSYLHGF